MAFHDDVLRDIRAGRVPRRFKTADLKRIPASTPGRYRVGNGDYSANTINTVPRNHSIRPDGTEPGDYVRKGTKPAFLWHGNGEYELILDHGHSFEHAGPEDEELDETEGDGEALVRAQRRIGVPITHSVDDSLVLRIAKAEGPDPAKIIVRYVAENRFQAHYRRKPLGSLRQGWGERIAAYYWPNLEQDWKVTCRIVTGLASRIQQAIRKLAMCAGDRTAANELFTAFKETCDWGGLKKLPESDSAVLAAEVLRAWQALSNGQTPPRSCRLNSAWTKLYAFSRPDECVIYDSRVAAALTSILDPAMDIISQGPKWHS
jgi:hypothetical protein